MQEEFVAKRTMCEYSVQQQKSVPYQRIHLMHERLSLYPYIEEDGIAVLVLCKGKVVMVAKIILG